MPAIHLSDALAYAQMNGAGAHQLVKRKSWPAREPGVMLVFCIVGVIAILLIGLFLHKKLQARRQAKAMH